MLQIEIYDAEYKDTYFVELALLSQAFLLGTGLLALAGLVRRTLAA